MSAQSGIKSSDSLTKSFKDYLSSGHRALFVQIESETLVPKQILSAKGDLTSDFDVINQELSDSQATYIIVRTDDNDKHIFISFVPDFAKIREKMLYASTKNTILRELGVEFSMVLQLNDMEEVSSKGWEAIKAHNAQENPLSEQEESLKVIKEMELMSLGGLTRNKKSLVNDNEVNKGKLQFAVSNELADTLEISNITPMSFVTVNIKDEQLILKSVTSINSVEELVSKIPTDQPNYNILKVSDDNISFIYTCPSGSKVRDRMIYASTKLGFINYLKSDKGFEFQKTIEVGDSDEIELGDLISNGSSSTVETPAASSNLRFSKPKGPRRR